MDTFQIISSVLVVAVALGSAMSYRREHRGQSYRRDRSAQPDMPRSFRTVYGWVLWSTPLAAILALSTRSQPWALVDPGVLGFVLGVAAMVLGFAVFARAKRTLGRQYSPCYDAYMPDALVCSGVYRFVRHPIYTGNLLLLAGMTLLTASPIVLLNTLSVSIYYWRSAGVEERALADKLPGYQGYLARTGRFLPRLRLSRNG